MKDDLKTWGAVCAVAISIFLAVCGWIANIVKLCSSFSDPLTGMMIARGIGVIFAPLGVVLGYL